MGNKLFVLEAKTTNCANNNNNNNNLYSCPEITQCRQIQKIKNYNRKEHSHLEIAKLIELSAKCSNQNYSPELLCVVISWSSDFSGLYFYINLPKVGEVYIEVEAAVIRTLNLKNFVIMQ